MVVSRSKFAEAASAARKVKVIVGETSPPPKHARQADEVIMPPLPPRQRIIEESKHLQPESSAMGASGFVPIFEPSTPVHAPIGPVVNVGVDSSWPPNIQCMALALTRTPLLLDDPTLAVLLAKNALRPKDRCCLSELEADELFDNIMHPTLESAFCAYIAKECNKVLRREFGTQEIDRKLLAKECSRLKT